jgi:TolA-binding protein
MKTHIIILMTVSLTLLPAVCGCSSGTNPVKIVLPPDFGEGSKPQSTASVKRFEQTDAAKTTAIEAAVEMSEKCSQLTAESAELKQKNESLRKERQQIENELEKTKTELQNTRRELSQANDLIMEMKVELNNWKADVLGFREEMRQADIAQLETLKKVLEILGGEVPGPIAADTGAKTTPTQVDPNVIQ